MIDVALVVGHRRSAKGARGNGLVEWDYWRDHVQTVAGMLGQMGRTATVVEREDTSQGYRKMPRHVLSLQPRAVVMFHLNAHSKVSAHGAECLVADGDLEDVRLGRALLARAVPALGLRDRGVKPVQQGHRGSIGLWGLLTVPATIYEPGFVSNLGDALKLRTMAWELCEATARGLDDFLG